MILIIIKILDNNGEYGTKKTKFLLSITFCFLAFLKLTFNMNSPNCTLNLFFQDIIVTMACNLSNNVLS